MKMKQARIEPEAQDARRVFDEAFKRHAVALMDGGRPVTQIARELDVNAGMLYQWKKKFTEPIKTTAPAPSDLDSLQDENRLLKMELERMRRREEILKKTLGILSEPESNATNTSRR